MKRAALLIFLSRLVFAAIPATTQWDVRTTGSDTFGGGFDPGPGTGIDHSQGAAAFVVIDNSAIKATCNTTTITFTNNTYTVLAGDVNNVVNMITGTGLTPARYIITSVGVGLNGTWVLDSTTGMSGGVVTSAKMGGSLLTIATAVASEGAASGLNVNTLWLQTGTYTLTTGVTWNKGNIAGYGTSHNDNGTKPLITTATNSTVLLAQSALSQILSNVSLSNTATVRAIGVTAAVFLTVKNCIFDGFVNAVNLSGSASRLVAYGIEVKNSTGAGLLNAAGNPGVMAIDGGYIHNNTGAGISDTGATASQISITNSIVTLNGAGGVVLGVGVVYMFAANCDFVSNTGVGMSIVGTPNTSFLYAINSIFYANTTYGISVTGTPFAGSGVEQANAYGANGTAPLNGVVAGMGTITLGASPFTSATDLSLNAVANGGALLKGTGFPGIFQGGTTTSHPDVGAVQSAAPTGGGQAAYPTINP